MSIIQGNTKVSAGGYQIDQSIRFNDDDAAYLSRTFGTPTDATNWTFSAWIKRCNLGTEQYFFNSGASAAAYYIRFESTDKIRFRASTSWDITTTEVFRDVSAWYHIVATFANGAVTLYVNNDSIATASVSDATYNFFTNIIHSIGSSTIGGNNCDLYLAEINGIDGQALAPTNFGEYNDDGVWIPKQYAGTYGNNGFYLKGQDSSNLGDDSSGNTNDFTASGLTSADQVSDSPTLNFPVISPIDYQTGSNVTISNGNLTFQNANSGSANDARATFAVSSGKWYWEVEADSLGQSGVGREFIGVVSPEWRLGTGSAGSNFSQDSTGYAYNTVGQKLNNGSASSYGSSLSAGDIVGVALDLDNGKIWWSVNGTFQASGDPAAGTNEAYSGLSGTFAPAFAVDYGTGTSRLIANFGQTGGLTYTPPTGFSQIDSSTLPEPTVKDGSAYFAAETYSGNGSTQEINFSGNSTFQPDMVILKERNGSRVWTLYDIIRGATNYLQPSQSDAESSSASSLSSFDADGFTLGSAPFVNNSGNTYISYSFLASNTTASNTDGDITSTVSVNATAGISIINFTGNGSSAQTIGHGLGVTPTTVLIKPVSASDNWLINNWAAGVTPFSEKFKWNSNEAADSTGTSQVYSANSTTFTVGSDPNVNGSGTEYFAVAWVEVPGFLRFTSYQGNGSSDGPFVSLGHKSRHFWIKEESSADDWVVYDTARDTYNVAGQVLRWDSLTSEFDGRSGSRAVDVCSNGLKIRTSNATINGSGVTYVVASWAEHPFGGDGVAPVPAR